jgi:hypothetical protein
MIRLLGENLRFTGGDGKVGFWDLENLGVVQFAIIGTVAVCLERGDLSALDFASMVRWGQTCGVSWLTSVLDLDVSAEAAPSRHFEVCKGEVLMFTAIRWLNQHASSSLQDRIYSTLLTALSFRC